MINETQEVVFQHLQKVKEEAMRKYAAAATKAIMSGSYESWAMHEAIRAVVEEDLGKARQEKKENLYYVEEQHERYDAYCEVLSELGLYPRSLTYLL